MIGKDTDDADLGVMAKCLVLLCVRRASLKNPLAARLLRSGVMRPGETVRPNE